MLVALPSLFYYIKQDQTKVCVYGVPRTLSLSLSRERSSHRPHIKNAAQLLSIFFFCESERARSLARSLARRPTPSREFFSPILFRGLMGIELQQVRRVPLTGKGTSSILSQENLGCRSMLTHSHTHLTTPHTLHTCRLPHTRRWNAAAR